MHRIEGIEAVLQGFFAFSFFAAVKPYGDKGKNRKSLKCKFKGFSEQLNNNHLTFKKNKVEQKHCDKLQNPRKREISEKIKHNNRQIAPETVIGETDKRCKRE